MVFWIESIKCSSKLVSLFFILSFLLLNEKCLHSKEENREKQHSQRNGTKIVVDLNMFLISVNVWNDFKGKKWLPVGPGPTSECTLMNQALGALRLLSIGMCWSLTSPSPGTFPKVNPLFTALLLTQGLLAAWNSCPQCFLYVWCSFNPTLCDCLPSSL